MCSCVCVCEFFVSYVCKIDPLCRCRQRFKSHLGMFTLFSSRVGLLFVIPHKFDLTEDANPSKCLIHVQTCFVCILASMHKHNCMRRYVKNLFYDEKLAATAGVDGDVCIKSVFGSFLDVIRSVSRQVSMLPAPPPDTLPS